MLRVNSLAVEHSGFPGINTRSVAGLKAAKGFAEWELGRDGNIGSPTSLGEMNTTSNMLLSHIRGSRTHVDSLSVRNYGTQIFLISFKCAAS